MKNQDKTDEELVRELESLRARVAELEESKARLKETERLLRESEVRSAFALDAAELSFWDWNLTTGKAVWSYRTLERLGYSPGEIEPDVKTWKSLVHPEDWPHVSKTMNDHLAGDLPIYEAEHRARTRAGDWIWILARGKVVERDPDGRAVRLIGTSLDITERKRAEEALRQSESKYRTLVENIPQKIFIKDRDSVYVSCNENFARDLGMRSDQCAGKTDYDFFPRELAHKYRADDKRIMEAGQTQELEEEYLQAGQEVCVQTIKTPIRQEDGTVIGILGIFWDITDRKKAEEALRESEEKFSTAFRSAPNSMMISSQEDGTLIEVNDAFVAAYGYERSEVLGKTAIELGIWKDADERSSWLQQVKSKGYARNVDLSFSTKDGRLRHGLHSTVAIQVQGKPFLLSTFNDITERNKAQEELRESEEKLRLVTETIQDVFWITTPGLQEMTYVSPAYEKVWGRPRESLYESPTSFMDSVHPEDREEVQRVIEEHQQGAWTCEYRIVHPDGTIRWIHGRGYPIWDESGNLRLRTGVATDITDRKNAEQALRDSEERLRLGWDTVPDALSIVRMENGTLIDVNNGFTVLSGYSREEVLGKSSLDIPIWHDPASRQRFVSCVLTDGNVRGFEAKMRRKDGKLRTVLMSAAQMTLHGEPHMFCVGREVEELYQAAKALRASEEKYHDIFENAVEGIFQTTPDGRWLSANPAIAKLLGYASPEEIINEVTDIGSQIYVRLEDREECTRHLKDLSAVEGYEFECRRKDGTHIWVSMNAHAVRDESGEVLYYEGMMEDITARKRAEGELAESEALLKAVLDASPVGIALVKNRKLKWANRTFYDLFGYEPDEIEQANVRQFYMSDDDYRRTGHRLYDGIVEGEVREIELLCKRRDGTSFPCMLRATMIHDAANRTLIVLFLDITKRKKAELALRESEARYRLLVENVNDAIFVAQDGFVKSPNSRLALMSGYALSEIAEQPFTKFIHPKDTEMVLGRHKLRVEGASEPRSQYQFRILRKDGDSLWVELGVTLIEWEGRPATLNVLRDVTERKESERKLMESEANLRSFIDAIPESLFLLKRDGTIATANKTFANRLGYSLESLIGPNIFDVTPVEVVEGRRRHFDEVINKQRALELEDRRGGRYFRNLAYPVFNSQGVLDRVAVYSVDVTEQRNLQDQLIQAQKMEAVGTLAGGIAHDFNNLLTVVMGFSELLLAEKDQEDPEYGDLQKIFHAAKGGGELVNRLLMFSRKSEPKPVPMNLNKQILQVEKLLRRTIPKMIDIRLDLSPDLPDINADPSQIEQVLMNLAVNARDAMPDGGDLTISTQLVTLDEKYCSLHVVGATPGDYVLLKVVDTGHGMDKATREHIFEPFFTTKAIGRGTGLGLAMVYGIVKQHNGHITVYSELGQGTTFRVYFPAMPAEAEPEVDTSGEMPIIGTESILLVDDEEFVRELGARILTKHGYIVLQAEDGRKALKLFKKERSRISLVILDLIMPKMAGSECLKVLLKIDPQVRVLVASGYSAEESVKDMIRMGARGFVTKPFRVNELLREVRKVLDEG